MPAPILKLREIFPRSDTHDLPEPVAGELLHNERVLWVGGPDRWGLFRLTPFALAPIGAYSALAYLGAESGITAWQMLKMLLANQAGPEALILPALGAGYILALGLALRDPRRRWTYVVTDHRLMTFFKGKKLREAGTQRLDRLRSLQSLEGRLRGIGDVVWARINKGSNSKDQGPDHGRHGFRGMKQPDQWKARLVAWSDALQDIAARDAGAFAKRASDPHHRTTAQTNMRRLMNRAFGFAMTLPEGWVGRIGVQSSIRLNILGLNMPFKQVRKLSNEPIHKAPETWNFIAISGGSGMHLKVIVNEGPPAVTFDSSRNKIGKSVIDAEGDYRCGPLSGFRVDYLFLNKLHCRFATLVGENFHMLINITMPFKQARHLMPAIDAVFDSIRPA